MTVQIKLFQLKVISSTDMIRTSLTEFCSALIILSARNKTWLPTLLDAAGAALTFSQTNYFSRRRHVIELLREVCATNARTTYRISFLVESYYEVKRVLLLLSQQLKFYDCLFQLFSSESIFRRLFASRTPVVILRVHNISERGLLPRWTTWAVYADERIPRIPKWHVFEVSHVYLCADSLFQWIQMKNPDQMGATTYVRNSSLCHFDTTWQSRIWIIDVTLKLIADFMSIVWPVLISTSSELIDSLTWSSFWICPSKTLYSVSTQNQGPWSSRLHVYKLVLPSTANHCALLTIRKNTDDLDLSRQQDNVNLLSSSKSSLQVSVCTSVRLTRSLRRPEADTSP